MQRTTSSIVLAGAVAAAVGALAACGSGAAGSDTGGVATIATTAPGPSDSRAADSSESDSTAADSTDATDETGTTLEAPTDENAAFTLYDGCMAKQGFPTDAAGSLDDGPQVVTGTAGEASSATPGDGPQIHIVGPGGIELSGDDAIKFQAADEQCRGHLANVQSGFDFTPEQQAAMEDASLKVEQCMKDKGFDVHFSVAGAGDGNVMVGNGIASSSDAPPADQPTGTIPDQQAMQAAMKECSKVFDDYPELKDVPRPG